MKNIWGSLVLIAYWKNVKLMEKKMVWNFNMEKWITYEVSSITCQNTCLHNEMIFFMSVPFNFSIIFIHAHKIGYLFQLDIS